MAATAADATEYFRAGILENLRARLHFARLTNRNFEGDAQTADTVRLINTAATNPSAETPTTTRNPDWETATEEATTQVTMDISQRTQDSALVKIDDYTDIVVSMFDDAINRVSRQLAVTIDQDIYAFMEDGVSAATPDMIDVYGDATDYVPTTGVPATAASRTLILEAFITAGHKAMVQNIWITGEIEHQLYAVMPPYMWTAIKHWILEDEPSEAMVNDYIGPATREAPGGSIAAPGMGGLVGNIMGIDVIVSNTANNVDSVSSKNHGIILFITPQYCTAGFREPVSQVFLPEQNQTTAAIGALARSYIRWGRAIANPNQALKAQIRQEA